MSVIKAKAIKMVEVGGPEVMQWVDVEVGEPGPQEVRIKHHAVGFISVRVFIHSHFLALLVWRALV
jgi:NADPH2:quinone reductase